MSNFIFDAAAFEDALESPPPVRATRISSVAPVASSTVTSTESGRSYLMVPPELWTWRELRDYVVTQIEQMHGPFPRHTTVEFGIFNGFAGRHGALAGPIAKYAFETSPTAGRWKGSPISVGRFARGSDPYFAEPIIAQLRQH